ncbi:hypothetical protein C3B78_03620 [Arthrobacter sp. PGP41]|uniref:hypothetical protein n=1 Tax=Arthrobacter sp. PGP41 TaxID=2079227 RepID=UPI000CDBD3C5|nr:hypothetical protein [Arthrobacter sp. PGP41]AUZ33645.1 hypothetical protein C3B78_03620 [Arthrobacter sp. PGP41]
MDLQPEYSIDEIAEASEAVKHAPGGVNEDLLVDGLYLGAFAAGLEARLLPEAMQWTAEQQNAILMFRSTGRSFREVMGLAAGKMLRARWLDRYFHGVCPLDADPRNANIALIGPLEELAMSAVIDVRFVVQVIRETIPSGRHDLLEKLAATSRDEQLRTRLED